MIAVTRLDGHETLVNPDLILTVESVPDTVLTFTTAQRLVVKESAAEVLSRVVAFKRRVRGGPQLVPPQGD